MSIKTNLDGAVEFLTELRISIGRAEICLDKALIGEPNLSLLNDALNDVDAIITAAFGKDPESGSLLSALETQKVILDESVT